MQTTSDSLEELLAHSAKMEAERKKQFDGIPEHVVEGIEAAEEHTELYTHQLEIVALQRKLRGRLGLSPDNALQVASTALILQALDDLVTELRVHVMVSRLKKA